MNNNLEYKGYIGSVNYSKVDKLYYGKILKIKDLVSYEAETETSLEVEFRNTVDKYVNLLKELNGR